MKQVNRVLWRVVCGVLLVSAFSVIRLEAAGQGRGQGQGQNQGQGQGQGATKTPPGVSKKDEPQPGFSKREVMPYDRQDHQDLLEMKLKEELQQAWCLERKGFVNYVLQDTTVCGCLTEDHVVAFVETDEWPKAIGLVLHHALVLRKDPGIVVFVENEGETKETRESSALASLNNVLEEFQLPITIWALQIEAKENQNAPQTGPGKEVAP